MTRPPTRPNILAIPSLGRLWELDLSVENFSAEFPNGRLTQEEVTHLLKLCGALWLYPWDINDASASHKETPHAELTSGKCSTGFIDVMKVLRFPLLCELLAYSLWEQTVMDPRTMRYHYSTDWVVGSAYAGIVFSYEMARLFGAKHGFTEKGEKKTQVWNREAFTIQPHEVALQIEELMTTAGTALAVREGIRQGNPSPVEFTPFVATLVHRSNIYEIEESPVIYLTHYDIDTWTPEECPLCKLGSPRVTPKQNWDLLTRIPA